MNWGDAYTGMDQTLVWVLLWWNLDGPVPVPRQKIPCPVCRGLRTHPRQYSFHEREGSRLPHRCDVMMKCHDCSAAWCHGVVVPEESYPGRLSVSARVIREAGGVIPDEVLPK